MKVCRTPMFLRGFKKLKVEQEMTEDDVRPVCIVIKRNQETRSCISKTDADIDKIVHLIRVPELSLS